MSEPTEKATRAPEHADVTVDARGLRCPEPLMVVRNKIMDMESGQIIRIDATDPSTEWDFKNFCRFLKHELIHRETNDDVYTYWIKKA